MTPEFEFPLLFLLLPLPWLIRLVLPVRNETRAAVEVPFLDRLAQVLSLIHISEPTRPY